MLASGKALTERDLIISRVEWDTGEGLIQAHGPDREATLRFQTVEPNHTRLHTDIFTGKRARDIACEEALSGHIDDMLAGDAIPPLEKMTAKMIPVYRSPRLSSPIVAYLAPGTVVRASTDKDGWTRVDLLSGTPGYVPSTTLRSAALTAP
jgi:SH3-like domain-containing protein